MPTHVSITDPYIHEPKGASSANSGEVYTADGLGSGSWEAPAEFPGGFGYYQHSTTGQVINTTPSKLEIDGAGALSHSGNLPLEIRGTGELWDVSNDLITPINLYDDYDLRIDMPITAETGAPTELTMQFDVGGGATPTIAIFERFFSTGKSTPYTVSFSTGLAVLASLVVTNGVQLFCFVDSGSITLGQPAIRVTRLSSGNQ